MMIILLLVKKMVTKSNRKNPMAKDLFTKKYPHIKIINFDALYYCANKDNIDKEIQNSEKDKLLAKIKEINKLYEDLSNNYQSAKNLNHIPLK